MGQLGSWRSDLVLPSIALLCPLWLDEELFGVETKPDDVYSLRGAEIGNLAVFNPNTKKYIFHPTNSTKSDCISMTCRQVSRVRCDATGKISLWRSQDRDVGGIFGSTIDPHQPLMKGEEETSDGAGLAIEYQGTVLPPEATGVDENPFIGIILQKVFGCKMVSVLVAALLL